MELKKLLFSNPTFHDGINVTVRSGYKWADALGEIVEVSDAEQTQEPEMAHVLGVLTTKLNTIPESILAQEHDPKCKTLEGITEVMKDIYGDIADDAPVTVLFFEFSPEANEGFETISNLVDVEIDMTDEEFISAASMAHDRGITLNQLITDVIAEFAANPDLIKDYIEETTEE